MFRYLSLASVRSTNNCLAVTNTLEFRLPFDFLLRMVYNTNDRNNKNNNNLFGLSRFFLGIPFLYCGIHLWITCECSNNSFFQEFTHCRTLISPCSGIMRSLLDEKLLFVQSVYLPHSSKNDKLKFMENGDLNYREFGCGKEPRLMP